MSLVLDGVNQYGLVDLGAQTSAQDQTYFVFAKSATNLFEAILSLCSSTAANKTVGIFKESDKSAIARFFPASGNAQIVSSHQLTNEFQPVMVKWVESSGTLSVQVGTNAAEVLVQPTADANNSGLSVGARFGGSGFTSPNIFFTGSIAHAAMWRGTALTGADVTDLMNGSKKPNELSVVPTHYKPFVNDQSGGIGTDYTLFNSPTINAEDPYAAAAPTITGPDTTTEGAATVQTGTLLNTVTAQSLISGSYSIEQTIDSQTATTLNYVAESGVNQCTPSTPVSGVPLAPTISAAGITPYVVQQKADDGTNPPATRNITLNPEATHEVIQTMAGVANTNSDQSVFGSTWVTVEDNHQARLPKVVDGVTFTWNDKGEFTTDIDKTVTFQYELFSPASGNWSAISLTVKDTSIIAVGPLEFSSVGLSPLEFNTLSFSGV